MRGGGGLKFEVEFSWRIFGREESSLTEGSLCHCAFLVFFLGYCLGHDS